MRLSIRDLVNVPISVSFSKNVEVEKIQIKAEELKIQQAVKNIVNHGNPIKDESGKVEWETCIISYESMDSKNFKVYEKKNKIIGHISMSDGTTLYESMYRASSSTRYTEIFRFGKWVERFLQYSEDLSKQHVLQAEIRKKELQEKLIKPFSEIDF